MSLLNLVVPPSHPVPPKSGRPASGVRESVAEYWSELLFHREEHVEKYRRRRYCERSKDHIALVLSLSEIHERKKISFAALLNKKQQVWNSFPKAKKSTRQHLTHILHEIIW